jgi:hypothetical protein
MHLRQLILGTTAGLVLAGICGCSKGYYQPFSPPNRRGPSFDSQLQSAKEVANPVERDDAVALVAQSAAEVGDVHWATQALSAINNWEIRDDAALAVAVRLSKGGKGDAAQEIARTIASSVVRDETLKFITNPK